MLNPTIRWEPGVQVRYHGSLTALHGVYAAHPCRCMKHDDQRTSVSLQLADHTGTVTVTCVRPVSVSLIKETQ